MGLTVVDLSWVRTYVSWTPPTDDMLNSTYDDEWSEWTRQPYYTPAPYIRQDQMRVRAAVAEWYVRARLSAMIDDPGSFSVDSGEYSESWTANMSALRERLKELQEMAPSDANAVGKLVRADGDFRGPPAGFVLPTSRLYENYGGR